MTRYLGADGRVQVRWDSEAEPVDWTTPDSPDPDRDHAYCGNCGWDVPGCGCPRDPRYGGDAASLPVQRKSDPPIPDAPAGRES